LEGTMESEDGSLLCGYLSSDLARELETHHHRIKISIDGKEIWDLKNISQPACEESHLLKKLWGALTQRGRRRHWEYEGAVADLFAQDAKLPLQGSDGSPSSSSITMRISLDSNTAKRIMEEVDANLARLNGNTTMDRASGAVGGAVSMVPAAYDTPQTRGTVVTPLGQALSVLVKVVHNISDVSEFVEKTMHHMYSDGPRYQAVTQQILQDADARDLADSLREMICAARDCPDLRGIEGTGNVIEEIRCTALQIAALIKECTKHPSLIVRTMVSPFKDLASRINKGKEDCIKLKEKFNRRVQMEMRLDVKEIVRNQEDEKILQWLAAPDPSVSYNTALEKRSVGTGSWFLNGEKFSEWKTKADVPLWISGIPGCGKTVLCSSIVKDIISTRSDAGSACAYFFFDGRDSQDEFQLHHKLIRSLIKQFTSHPPSIPPSLKHLYGTGDYQPSLLDLEKTLHEILDQFSDAFIIVDSLDECSERRNLLRWITNVCQQKTGKLHLLVTSWPEQDVVVKMGTLVRVSMEAEDIAKDIESYVNSEITTDERLTLIPISDLRTKVVEGFDWLHFGYTNYGTVTPLMNCKKFYRTYQQIYMQYRLRVLRILQWLAFSMRHLSLEEVAEAVAVDMSGKKPHFDITHRFFNIEDILLVCGGFVSHSQESSDIQTNASLAHSAIAQTCLAYLLQFTELMSTNDIMDEFPLAQYAAHYWFDHARFVDDGDMGVQLPMMLELLQPDHGTFMVWIRLYDPDNSFIFSRRRKHTPSPLYYAALMGLQQASQKLLDQGADPNIQVGRYGSALHIASSRGHVQVVEILLSKGADPNIQGGQYGSALYLASSQGYTQVVKLLLSKSADPNIQGEPHGYPLHIALSRGHMQVVELLLSKGADPNIQGANPNIQGGLYRYALHTASSQGHVQVVKLLLSKGADPNIQDGQYGSALHIASSQ
ncbi:hypothetical protein BJ138DRAFT_1194414, partial [Hygrophoropsis aurantiaca]